MRPTISLIRVLVNVAIGLSAGRYRYLKRRERLWEPVLIIGGIGIAAGTFGWYLYQFFLQLAGAGLALGQPGLVLVIPAVSAQMLVFVTGIFALLSTLYFSRDLEVLVPLPLTPSSIVTGKFVSSLVLEYPVVFLLFVPGWIAFAVTAGSTPLQWLVFAVVLVLMPVLPLALAGIPAMLMMRVLGRARHRETLMVVASILLVIGIMGFQYASQRLAVGGEQEYLTQILSEERGLITAVSRYFPPAAWVAISLAEAGTAAGTGLLLLLIGTAVLGVVVIQVLGTRVFLPTATAVVEVRRIAGGATAWQARMRQRSVLLALVAREWKSFVRTPIFMLNGGLAVLIVPVMLLMPAVSRDQIGLFAALMDATDPTVIVPLLGTLIAFLSSLNTVAATTLSREGTLVWIARSLPLPSRTVIGSKLLHALSAGVVSALPTLVVAGFVLGVRVELMMWALILGTAGGAVSNAIGVLFDVWRPYLNWQHPRQAVKSNLNALIPLVVLIPLVYGGMQYLEFAAGLGWDPLMSVAVLTGVVAGLGLVIQVCALGLASGLYRRVEV